MRVSVPAPVDLSLSSDLGKGVALSFSYVNVQEKWWCFANFVKLARFLLQMLNLLIKGVQIARCFLFFVSYDEEMTSVSTI